MLKLLLVDDQPRELEGMKSMLNWSEMGIEVAGVAINGRQALALAKDIPIDIVITDVVMPDMDGIQLIRELKKLNPHIRSICISGFDEFKLVSQAINSGASGYVLKPVLTSEMQTTLNHVLDELRRERTSVSAIEAALAYLCADARNWTARLSPELLRTSFVAGVGSPPENIELLAFIALESRKNVWLADATAQLPADALAVGPMPLAELQQPLIRLLAEYRPPMSEITELSAVETIKQNIHQHLCEPIDEETLLSGIYLSRSYASALFKNETGITIHRYIKQERLKLAMQMLLDDPDAKVTSIAQQCGFSDASHLTNSMQKQFGITPERYRRRKGKL